MSVPVRIKLCAEWKRGKKYAWIIPRACVCKGHTFYSIVSFHMSEKVTCTFSKLLT